MSKLGAAAIPMRVVGPISIISNEISGDVQVPMVTFEAPLWPSTARGAKVSRAVGGIKAVIVDEGMSRSVVVETKDVMRAYQLVQDLQAGQEQIAAVVAKVSRFARFKDLSCQIVGTLVYVRLAIYTGDASGHNMVTAAAEALLNWILANYEWCEYVSISANYCTDKKVSAVNAILGRGKYVVADLLVPRRLCLDLLRTTPEKIVDLHIKKNLLGSILAGSLRSANAHFANMLLAIFLATGQDAANIIEASQGIVHAEVRGEDLYFSVSLTNLIVGTVGNGKDLEFTRKNLELLGCLPTSEAGWSARRLAIIVAATVLCGELSLLAAQTNPGELMRTHLKMERSGKHDSSATKI